MGLVLGLAGLGALCALLFRMAAYALPVFAAVTTALYANESGVGPVGAVALALLAGIAILVLGRFALQVRFLPVRIAVAAVFVVPAVVAGYAVVHGLSGFGGASDTWRLMFGVFGAAIAGSTALARLVIPADASTNAFVPDEQTGRSRDLPSIEPDRRGSSALSRRRRTCPGHGRRRGVAWR